ncbi:MAG: mannose-1-phosphate guanylyltransferase [Terriglobales bacterium]
MKPHPHFYPVILAGGRGTRFWPLSRKRRAKQLLALDGKQTMIQQTLARLLPLAPAKSCWVITNDDLRLAILRQLPKLSPRQVIAEPAGRNTAPAIGLAAFLLLRHDPEAVLGMFPSDHVIAEPEKFRATLNRGIALAAAGDNIVVLGIRPTRPETGYGYIEAGEALPHEAASDGSVRVRRFTEKPDIARARKFVEAGNYFWNSGMFLWRADTVAAALREHLPKTAAILEKIAAAYCTRKFASTFRRLYPQCENISVDYAILEPRSVKGESASRIFCLPSDFGWNDLGSWTALHEHHTVKGAPGKRTAAGSFSLNSATNSAFSFSLNSENNFVHAPGKFVATVGVNNLVVVVTEDALLITTLEQSQDVGKVVKHLDEKELKKLV